MVQTRRRRRALGKDAASIAGPRSRRRRRSIPARRLGAASPGPFLLAQNASNASASIDPALRTRALFLLAAVAILGMIAIFLFWAGSRAARHALSSSPKARRRGRTRPREDDWAGKPLVPEVTDSQIREEDPGP